MLDYPYFQKHCKILAIDLGKFYELETDSKGLKKRNKSFLNFDKELCEYCKFILVKHNTSIKAAISNAAEVALNLSSNMIGDSNDETSFSNK